MHSLLNAHLEQNYKLHRVYELLCPMLVQRRHLSYAHLQEIMYIFNMFITLRIIRGTENLFHSQSEGHLHKQLILKFSTIILQIFV